MHKTPTKVDREKEAKQLVLQKCCKDIEEATKKLNGRKPYGIVSEMVKDLEGVCPWISRHVINFAYKKYLKEKEGERKESDSPHLPEDLEVPPTSKIKPAGRPNGTTKDAKYNLKVRIRDCRNAAAAEFHEQKNIAKKEGKYVKKGCLEDIIRKQKDIFKLPDDIVIGEEGIRSRHYRGNLQVTTMGVESPMAAIEPKLVELIIRMSRIRRCLTPSQCLLLANDLVEGTKIEKEVIKFKEKRYKRKFEKASLGQNYWNGFKKRYSHLLTFQRGQKFALDRSAALTFSNINKMYEEVYAAMTECKVASILEKPQYFTVDGEVAKTDNEKFGLPCTHMINHPEMCLVVDEVGSDLSQKGDGHVGGALYACERGTVAQNKVQHSDKHFTLLGFTNLSGEPVLCLVIIAGVQEALNVESGIDPFATETYGETSDVDYFDKNFGPGKLFPGGPTCKINNKEIPCMVRWTPKGSITSQILAESLQHIDSFEIFDRTNGKYPFLLLDGHQSRFELPFLDYVCDNQHKWQVCIGVPYGTSLWQVGDSKEQNGSYKIALARAKKDFFEKKLRLFIDPPQLSATDIIPLINKAWSASFARVSCNKKAIAERGWGPCNRNLLLYKEIQHTMTKDDTELFHSMQTNFFPSTSNFASAAESPPESVSFLKTAHSSSSTIISDLTDMQQHTKSDIISLNYSSGNSAMVLETLIGHHDINEARERNKKNRENGQQVANTYKKAKALTAMYHFNMFGCKIGKTALEKKRELQLIQQEKIEAARKKEEDAYFERKRKYDDVMKLGITDDEKLTGVQLRSLLNMKKRKTDKPISSMKKSDMLTLWKEWKTRPVEAPQFEHELVESVHEVQHDDVDITARSKTTANEDGKENEMVSV